MREGAGHEEVRPGTGDGTARGHGLTHLVTATS